MMKQAIKDRYNDTILQEAMLRYGIAANQIHALDAFESFIYEFDRDGRELILRITHSLRRSEALIQGEVDWINYLVAGGVSASRAILSQRGELVEAIDDQQGGTGARLQRLIEAASLIVLLQGLGHRSDLLDDFSVAQGRQPLGGVAKQSAIHLIVVLAELGGR